MEKPQKNDKQPHSGDQTAEHDSRGTKIERVPGPGPKDDGKGAVGKEAKERLDRKG